MNQRIFSLLCVTEQVFNLLRVFLYIFRKLHQGGNLAIHILHFRIDLPQPGLIRCDNFVASCHPLHYILHGLLNQRFDLTGFYEFILCKLHYLQGLVRAEGLFNFIFVYGEG